MRREKTNKYYNIAKCPVVFYSHFVSVVSGEMYGTVTIKRFEDDIVYLKSRGYIFLSIQEMHECINDERQWPDKPLILAFVDGFESNYTLAFDVIKKHNIHCDIFLCPDFVGMKKSEGCCIPRFDWVQANEMCESGLVNIHSLYHQSQNSRKIDHVANESVIIIKEKLGGGNGDSFLNTVGDLDSVELLYNTGIKSQIVFYHSLNSRTISKGCIGHFSVEHGITIQESENIIESFKSRLLVNLNKEINLISNNNSLADEFLSLSPENIDIDICKEPVIANRPKIAFALSVLKMDNFDSYNDFALVEFLPLMAIPNINYLDFDNYNYHSWSLIESYSISPELLDLNNINILKYLYKALSNGFCADMSVDAYFIPGKSFYHKSHTTHGIMIFGYNAKNCTFNAMTHIETGKYEELSIGIRDLLLSCSTNYFEYFYLIKRNYSAQMYYSSNTVRKLLEEYLHSKETINFSKYCRYYYGEQIFGLNASLWVSEYIQKVQGYISNVTIITYIEHKKCMAWRIRYIAKKGGFSLMENENNLTLLEGCDYISGLCVKYNITKNEAIKNRLVDKINCINIAETELIKSTLLLMSAR